MRARKQVGKLPPVRLVGVHQQRAQVGVLHPQTYFHSELVALVGPGAVHAQHFLVKLKHVGQFRIFHPARIRPIAHRKVIGYVGNHVLRPGFQRERFAERVGVVELEGIFSFQKIGARLLPVVKRRFTGNGGVDKLRRLVFAKEATQRTKEQAAILIIGKVFLVL